MTPLRKLAAFAAAIAAGGAAHYLQPGAGTVLIAFGMVAIFGTEE